LAAVEIIDHDPKILANWEIDIRIGAWIIVYVKGYLCGASYLWETQGF
jgi:hypothetical protein